MASSSTTHPQHHSSFQYRSLRPTTPSPRDPTIRHAGRAHIRGKIRRVWRPRYLELCDTGLVRYYELPPTADVTLPEDSDWDHVNMIPKDTLVIYHARIIDVTTLRDLHVGLPKGSYGFLFRGQRVCHLELQPQNEPPREFFCAVSTLEEAQTWVIVLQWAASVCKATHQNGDFHSQYDGVNFLGDSCHIPSASRKPSVLESRTASRIMKREENWLDASSAGGSSIGAATTNTSNTDTSPTVVVSKPKKMGRIVVTKVEDYQLIRVPASAPASLLYLQWQVAYKLDLLLIQGPKVEERRVLRTAHDFTRLLEELTRELDSKISLTLIDDWRCKLQTHPLPPVALQDYTHSSDILLRVTLSFPLLNRFLRALAMDANIVNSHAVKKCFLLDTDHPCLSTPKWWKPLTPHELERTLLVRRTIAVAEDDTDAFVKTWLVSRRRFSDNWKTKTWLWVLQRPWMVLGGTGVGLALSVPLARVYQQMMVTVSLRFDVLMGSWCLAAYLGKEYWATKSPTRSQSSLRPPVSRPPLAVRITEDTHQDSHHHSSHPPTEFQSTVVVAAPPSDNELLDTSSVDSKDYLDYLEHHDEDDDISVLVSKLSSPLPQWPHNNGESCWSSPRDNSIFRVRGRTYFEDRVKIPSGPSPFQCRGVDVWLTDNPERHIARHPSVLNGKLHEHDTFLVNFLLPFGNFVSYFTVPPLSEFPDKLGTVWTKFVKGDQQYRDKRLKLLPVVMDGPWIVRAAVGNGTAPALLGKVIPLQYYFHESQNGGKAVYEVDVIITASSIAKGILSVVKGHTKSLTIAFAFIIEAAEQEELPETVLCAFQVHQLHLEDCPHLPECNLDDIP